MPPSPAHEPPPLRPEEARAAVVRRLARAFAAAGLPDPALDARLLAGAALDASPAALLASGDAPLGAEGARRLGALAARRLAREPVGRILGVREFWGLPFRLGTDVLEPRPDTETVVAAALAAFAGRAGPASVLDLGTGSGCLLVALLHERPDAWGLGLDRSPAALRIARGNARAAGLGGRALFAAADWTASLRARFDLVVSNPPYVERGAIPGLAPEVARHDPPAALDGGPDGLDAYRAILPALPALLAEGGVAVLEIGEGQGPAVAALAAGAGLAVRAVRPDLAGIDRAMVVGRP